MAESLLNPRRYGKGYGREGMLEDPTRCISSIVSRETLYSWQCSRKRGHGKGGLYCKQHAKQGIMP